MNSKRRILIVDDSPINIKILAGILRDEYDLSAATSGDEALQLVASSNYKPDLIILDIMMPGMDGYEVCRRLKEHGGTSKIPILFLTAKTDMVAEAKGLDLGAVDYISKPIQPLIVKTRVKNHMKLYLYQEHLSDLVADRTQQLQAGYIDTIHRLTLASEYKDEDTGSHIKRISYYTKAIAQQMKMSHDFCEAIFYASPMHDIGKVAIPDAILLKPGPLDQQEWKIMESHTLTGANILNNSESPYLQLAVDIAKSHHERWDGSGYPHGLKREEIPLTARIMSICDQYDALRSRRPYKKPFEHKVTVKIITEGDGRTLPEHFDPDILNAFSTISDVFCDIFESYNE